ncbi:MAG: transcription elongation factor GreA [Chloroflexi bacterium]|nr:transcription elongation factor GreA [Chloroflexota bacterium]
MMKKQIDNYLTPAGADKLREELKQLVEVQRVTLAERLRDAIRMGDLSENADYIAAKEDQAFLEGRILELEATLRDATVIKGDAVGRNGLVGIGSKVTVLEDGSAAETYTLVGSAEADPRKGLISNQSPIGMALLGKRAGDTVKAKMPDGGTLSLKIDKVA